MEYKVPGFYALSSQSAPFMMLPVHVDGYIDLPTLVDIHRFLSQSSLEEDQALADWIKAHYLYEPIMVAGREIRTTEGFSKLDHAYRRVRSLTNKAQDKWPFFDRNWKHMSSTRVRNNARGESAPGVSLPGMQGVMHDSPMTNKHNTHQDETSLVPSESMPWGTKQDIRYQQNSQVCPSQQSFTVPGPNTPTPLPPTKQVQLGSYSDSEKPFSTQERPQPEMQSQQERSPTEDLPKYADLFPRSPRPESTQGLESEGVRAPSEHSDGVEAPSEETVEKPVSAAEIFDTPQSGEPAQSTAEDLAGAVGGGKVRGPNGRYLPKIKSESGARKYRRSTGSVRTKGGRKSRTTKDTITASEQAEATTPALTDGEDETMVDAPSIPAFAQRSDREKQDGFHGEDAPAPALTPANEMGRPNVRSLSEHTGDDPPLNMVLAESFPAYTTSAYLSLAAEAEAVSSNLDKLPPSSTRKNKRKNEVVTHQGPPRKRGRPRKVDVADRTAGETSENAVTKEPSTTSGTGTAVEGVPRMATRRTTRRSAANFDAPTPAKLDTPQQTPTKLQEVVEDEDKTMVDVEEDTLPNSAPAASKSGPSRAQSKVQFVPETPLQSAVSACKDPPFEPDVELLALGLHRTNTSDKRSEPKKTVPETPSKNMDLRPNGSGAASEPVSEFISDLTKEPTSALSAQAQLVNSTSTEDDAAPNSVQVDYLARVHTSSGMVEIPMTHGKLNEEALVVQRYAEWMKTQKSLNVPFEMFQSIFSIAKKA